jgi:hypothetical protein
MHYLGMTIDDLRILKFENELGQLPRWRKESAIQRHLKLTGVRYHQRLSHLIREPEALERFPQLVYRLRALAADRASDNDRRLIGRDA